MSAANYKAIKMHGFSLIEVMVALLVFWLGLLGVGSYTAAGLRMTAVNQVRSTVIKATSIVSEPMIYQNRVDCLATMLGLYPRTVTLDNGKDSYVISLASVKDGGGTTLTNASGVIVVATADWVSPVTISLNIPYAGLTAMVNATPTFTVATIPAVVGACNA